VAIRIFRYIVGPFIPGASNMIVADLPQNEEERLQTLYESQLLDTAEEEEFSEIVQLVSQICGTPISLISFIDRNRQWFKAKKGLDDSETPRDMAFCSHAILQGGVFVVPDAMQDMRFADSPYVLGAPYVRFYAGVPVCASNGHAIGTLCVIGPEPRSLSEREERALTVLARHVSHLVDLRIAQNLTQRLVAELHDRNATLEQLTRAATRLLSVMAHDVRSPLASIIALIDEFSDTPDVIIELLPEIRRQAVIAKDILDQTLTWTGTMLRGDRPMARQTVDVRSLFDEEVGLQDAVFREKNITVEAMAEEGEIDVDPYLLRFVVHTLLGNATKFTENGSIRLDARTIGNELVVTISDTGMGMPADVLQRLFDWSRRHGRPGTRSEQGAGLALLLVKEFLDMIHGTIEVHSEEGSGTTFAIHVPLSRDEAMAHDDVDDLS